MIVYTDKFIPAQFDAVTRGPLIFVRPAQRGNDAIIAHEKAHRLQWFLTLGLSPLIYAVWPWYRMWMEVFAYRAGLKHKPEALDSYAWFLCQNYGLGITVAQAKELLRD